MPQTFELCLTGFRFPSALPRRKANFRFVVDVRYVNGRGEHTTEHAVMPDLDRLWECDPQQAAAPHYVRGPDENGLSTLSMGKIDAWDRLVLLVRGDGIHSAQFKVFDVNRPDAWDRLRRALGDVVRTLVGRARAVLPEKAGVLSDSLGSAATDLESALLIRLAGGDRLLFRGSTSFAGPGEYLVAGHGRDGDYEIHCRLSLPPDA